MVVKVRQKGSLATIQIKISPPPLFLIIIVAVNLVRNPRLTSISENFADYLLKALNSK